MIAGALGSYHRGPIVGATTFGKGCAQEYLDDERPGRRTAPDDAALLRCPTGRPCSAWASPPRSASRSPSSTPDDREATLPHAPPSWHGPDVRDRSVLAHVDDGTWSVSWPSHGGNVGPCKDGDTCRALRMLGPTAATARRTTAGKGR